MEHVIYHSIMSHLNHNDVLSNSQHGFRAGYSCSTQLISLIEDLNSHMDRNLQVDMIPLDFSKAFDTVPHCCLLKKLAYLMAKVSTGLESGSQHTNNGFYLMGNHLPL